MYVESKKHVRTMNLKRIDFFFGIFKTDINECKTVKPCQNGGTCENVHGSYRCSCKTGYAGKNCQKGEETTHY